MITLYNSLTRKKEEFHSLQPNKVGLYTCGPTVYDFPHIGNMRGYIIWDILKRFFQSQDYSVTHIMNVTDVGHLTGDTDAGEDKMEVARKRERLTAWQIAEKYFDIFKRDTQSLNILLPTQYVKATELIQAQIDFAKLLEEKGFLYRTSDGMYFDTSKATDYGRIGRLDVKGMQAGARVEFNPEKKNPTDFGVWKFSPTGAQRDMEWDSPWGKGFPGWHLECSVIALKYLSEQFDIHTGGIDHLTVHHPNEIAQSQAVTGEIPARYWLHNNFINYRDKKMAKSAGTFVRLEDVVAGGVAPLGFRYYLLQTHYRKEIAYSWAALKAADQGLKNLYKEISFFKKGDNECQGFIDQFYTALADDLNTAKALDIMQKLVKSNEPSCAKLNSLFVMDAVLGLDLKKEWERRQHLPEKTKELLHQRQVARDEKDWGLADHIRTELLRYGVEVQDTKDGQVAVLIE